MTCICEARNLSENFKIHSETCIEWSRKKREKQFKARIAELEDRELRLRAELKWHKQDHPCSGSGYSHKSHGKCPGYSTDRT